MHSRQGCRSSSAVWRSTTRVGSPGIPTATWLRTRSPTRCSERRGSRTSARSFPSDDERYRGADSLELLAEAYRQVVCCRLRARQRRLRADRPGAANRAAARSDGRAPRGSARRRACADRRAGHDDRLPRLHRQGRGPRGPGRGPSGADQTREPSLLHLRRAPRAPRASRVPPGGVAARSCSSHRSRTTAGTCSTSASAAFSSGSSTRRPTRSSPRGTRCPCGSISPTCPTEAGSTSIEHGTNGDEEPTLVSAIQVLVDRNRHGSGLSALMLGEMRRIAHEAGYGDLVAPVRPSLKSRYPLTPIDEYLTWTTEEALPFDPWLRVHARAGATIEKVCAESMIIPGTHRRLAGVDGDAVPGQRARTSCPVRSSRSRWIWRRIEESTSSRTSGCTTGPAERAPPRTSSAGVGRRHTLGSEYVTGRWLRL